MISLSKIKFVGKDLNRPECVLIDPKTHFMYQILEEELLEYIQMEK